MISLIQDSMDYYMDLFQTPIILPTSKAKCINQPSTLSINMNYQDSLDKILRLKWTNETTDAKGNSNNSESTTSNIL